PVVAPRNVGDDALAVITGRAAGTLLNGVIRAQGATDWCCVLVQGEAGTRQGLVLVVDLERHDSAAAADARAGAGGDVLHLVGERGAAGAGLAETGGEVGARARAQD